jgi:predicted nucleic acid-binding protein
VKIFVDSNVPMYIAGSEHPNRAPARAFLAEAQSGAHDLCTSTEVLQEILYRYSALDRLDLAEKVYDFFVALVPEVFDVTIADTDLAKGVLVDSAGLSARDAIHAAVMMNHDVEVIATFDRGFDRIGSIRRLEPS